MSESDKVMRSLLKQLTLQDGAVHKAVFDEYERLHNSAQLTAIQCVDLTVEISSQSQVTFIIFDGFDECSINVQRGLATHLQDLMQKARGTIRLFISGRPSVEPRLSGWIHDEINVRDNNLKDLSFLVREKVSSAADSFEFKSLYWLGGVSRAEAVIAAIEMHAHGMFRWVQSAINYLHESKFYGVMTSRLHNLHELEDLHELYEKIWDNAIRDAKEAYKAMKTLMLFTMYRFEAPTFRWMGINYPEYRFGLKYVAYAAAFTMDLITSEDNPPMSLPDLVRLCPDFVEYEEMREDGLDVSKLRLPHISVKEFLEDRHNAEYSPTAGHAFLAQLCMLARRHDQSSPPP